MNTPGQPIASSPLPKGQAQWLPPELNARDLYPPALRAIAAAIEIRAELPLLARCQHNGQAYCFDSAKWLRAKADAIEASTRALK